MASVGERTGQNASIAPMDFFAELDAVKARWNVLEHPFYTRWSAGELTKDELAVYAGEYRHAVVALAEASERVAELEPALASHATEERAHVALWDRFADASGTRAAVPAPETVACAEAWSGAHRDLPAHLAALYAIESAQPAIAQTKADGLREHYGYTEGVEYFDLHATRDVEHAAEERALLEPHLADADVSALLAEAEAVLEANWRLLDGVERMNAS
jgi:pyrroloquinoline-quinone synthase